jgi:hypothetical protein
MVSVRSNVDRAEANGSILLGSQDGVLVIHSAGGTFGDGGSAEGGFRAEVDVRLADPLDAIPFELLQVLAIYELTGSTLLELLVKLDDLITAIEVTAKLFGFPDLNISPRQSRAGLHDEVHHRQ